MSNILYINGNYPHHSLHRELITKLADMGDKITVFVPLAGKDNDGKYKPDHENVLVKYNDILNKLDRIFFIYKIHKIADIIEKECDIRKIDYILAGTVYSDGMAAYLLHKKYNIPFSVAVRETDITTHMKWRPYLNGQLRKLLQKTEKVILISPSYTRYFDRFMRDHRKYVTIPNAVNDFWFDNQCEKRKLHKPIVLIYVGEISKRKNVGTTIRVVSKLKKQGISAEFHIVGAGKQEDECRALAKECGVEEQIFFHGWQNGKEKIKEYYDKADIFVMLSHTETFGTVYVEAISQGLPVIYTKGQGIDGYFDQGTIGYACAPNDVEEIAESIKRIVQDYDRVSQNCLEKSKQFQWDNVARLYNNVIHQVEFKNE